MKSQRIEFFNSEPSIIENYPIIESKDLKLDWVKRARENFQKQDQAGNTNAPEFVHLSKCPGIFDLFKHGYIVTLHKDVIIKPKGKNFEWQLPQYRPLHEIHYPLTITGQSVELLPRPPWVSDFIIKIGTGWHIIAPKGIKFIMLPIAYPDTFDFTSTIGILNPALSTSIIFQMYWNATEPETLILAGTPLGHLIPLTEKKYQMVQRIMNQRDKDWVEKVESAYASSFLHTTMRGKIVDMYNKYWNC